MFIMLMTVFACVDNKGTEMSRVLAKGKYDSAVCCMFERNLENNTKESME
jgi:hypothetical protein